MLDHKSEGTFRVSENRFREKSVRIILGNAASEKLLWTGNEKDLGGLGNFLAKMWEDKVI